MLLYIYVSSEIKGISFLLKWNSALFTQMGREEGKGSQDPAQFKGLYTVGLNMKVKPEILP